MPRVAPAEPPIHPIAQQELDRQLAAHGRVTNMKRTLAHSPQALVALMTWYPLRDEVAGFLGDRLTTLFAHAVSAETDCLVCSTYFRRILIESGDAPDAPRLDARDTAVLAYGRALARDLKHVPDETYRAVATWLTAPQLVALTAFGAMMIATNVFNNAIEVELDEYLGAYRREAER